MKEKRKNYEKIDNSLLRVLKRKELWIFFIYGFILGGAFSIFETFIPPLSFEKFNFSKLSLYFIAYAITTISFRIIFSKKFDVIDPIILLFTAFSSLIIGAINTGFLVNKFQLMLSGFLYGITHAILYPLLSSGVVKLSLEKDKYLVNSTFIACYISGCITISTLSGRLADLTKKTESVFLALTFIGIISLFSTLFIKNKNYLQFKKKN